MYPGSGVGIGLADLPDDEDEAQADQYRAYQPDRQNHVLVFHAAPHFLIGRLGEGRQSHLALPVYEWLHRNTTPIRIEKTLYITLSLLKY